MMLMANFRGSPLQNLFPSCPRTRFSWAARMLRPPQKRMPDQVVDQMKKRGVVRWLFFSCRGGEVRGQSGAQHISSGCALIGFKVMLEFRAGKVRKAPSEPLYPVLYPAQPKMGPSIVESS
jgi:hypothetical protein